jgi:hypothetical protein
LPGASAIPIKPSAATRLGLLGGLGKTFLAQPIDRGLDVTRGFAERRLAVHHACAGHVAQVLDHLCGDDLPSYLSVCGCD